LGAEVAQTEADFGLPHARSGGRLWCNRRNPLARSGEIDRGISEVAHCVLRSLPPVYRTLLQLTSPGIIDRDGFWIR
jgi:hypothetical protein